MDLPSSPSILPKFSSVEIPVSGSKVVTISSPLTILTSVILLPSIPSAPIRESNQSETSPTKPSSTAKSKADLPSAPSAPSKPFNTVIGFPTGLLSSSKNVTSVPITSFVIGSKTATVEVFSIDLPSVPSILPKFSSVEIPVSGSKVVTINSPLTILTSVILLPSIPSAPIKESNQSETSPTKPSSTAKSKADLPSAPSAPSKPFNTVTGFPTVLTS